MGINMTNILSYGIFIKGMPLDGETQVVITFSMLENLQTVICYDYEDGKKWHDLTCVMELIFCKRHTDYDEISKIRYLYDHPQNLFKDFAALITDRYSDQMISVRMDLTAGWFQHDNKDKDICFDDFDSFNCSINHKKHFHPENPEMPDD